MITSLKQYERLERELPEWRQIIEFDPDGFTSYWREATGDSETNARRYRDRAIELSELALAS